MCDNDTDAIDSDGKPWRDEDTLRELRVEKGMAFYEMAEELGCSRSTVSNWVKRHGIGPNHECQICGMSEEDHIDTMGFSLDVHHLTRKDDFEDYKEANKLENLITLCRVCHRTWEDKPVFPQIVSAD